jgi:hypothetical protein
MGKTFKRETLEDLREINVQIQEDNQHLKERLVELEKDLETFEKLFPLLKEHFFEYHDTLAIIIANWNKSKVQLLQLGEKFIQLDY